MIVAHGIINAYVVNIIVCEFKLWEGWWEIVYI